MPELDTQDREKLRDSQFAYIDKDGDRKLPIHDEEHVRNAIQRFGQTDFESGAAKKRAAQKVIEAAREHDIEVSDDDEVARSAR